MDCPDGHGALRHAANGARCARCGGLLAPFAGLDDTWAGATAHLHVEPRADAAPYKSPRACPACSATMAPWRIGKDALWVDRCPSCDEAWLERTDQAALARLLERAAAAATFQALPREERQALVAELAAPPEGERTLSPFHKALTFVGIPVVVGAAGDRLPVATWALAALLVATSFVSPEQGGYLVGSSGPLALLTAGFVHFGVWHLVGNVAFLLSFGDGLEQRAPRTVMIAAFVLGALITTAVQALVSPAGVLIGGASGGVALVIGACAVVQPRARVAIRPVLWAGVQLPIVVFAAAWFALQAWMWLAGAQGIGWAAHLSGMALGVVVGFVVRRLR
ncbi:MAG: rhomboid family intramembrane serine protease [Deltaproteobacteria bacterium]|nr:rhomboid family intramembrane serine protease [Deltaproteobacteria bacterium]